MTSIPTVPVVSLADAERRYKNAARAIMDSYEADRPARTDQVTPQQLDAAIEVFFRSGREIERQAAQNQVIDGTEVTRLGDYGITLLVDLSAWAQRLGLKAVEADFDTVLLAFADWTMRHAGELHTIEPLVDAAANLANRTRDATVLEHLTHLMARIIRATAQPARAGVGQVAATQPWRLLHLNRGIVATRTRNTALMEEAFDDLVRNVPGEARLFFAEGMQQMDALRYPVHVRAVMARYFDRWTRGRMH
ncbi:MAG: hypothetical protein ACJ8KA_08425 [Sulfurifustis sp.]